MFIGLIQVIGCLIPGKLTLLEKAFPNCIQIYIVVSWGQWARLLGALLLGELNSRRVAPLEAKLLAGLTLSLFL